jgi:acetyltransferase-like isoleucine patch superfamily enzyme
MRPADTCAPILAPREGVNDDTVQLLQWLVPEGTTVKKGDAVAVLQTAKATLEATAPGDGFLYHLFDAGTEVPVGTACGLVSFRKEKPASATPAPAGQAAATQIITQKAQALIGANSLPVSAFAGLAVVRAEDVERLLHARSGTNGASHNGSADAADGEWDEVLTRDLHAQIKKVLAVLRRRMKAKHHRHVPTGEHLNDRWELAAEYGFGPGTSVYDSCVILGDVRVGRDCWIGPYTILDGNFARLEIGDGVDVGAGTHIYTHNTIERALTGRVAPVFSRDTRIGSCCFIAPHTVIAPGTVLGDHCFVAAGSYVEGVFPAYSWIAGNPAKKLGVVELKDRRARLRPDGEIPHGGSRS